VTFCASLTPVVCVFIREEEVSVIHTRAGLLPAGKEGKGKNFRKKWKNEKSFYLEAQEQRVQVREDAHEQRAQVVADHGFIFCALRISFFSKPETKRALSLSK